jgi:hypothetical protein
MGRIFFATGPPIHQSNFHKVVSETKAQIALTLVHQGWSEFHSWLTAARNGAHS